VPHNNAQDPIPLRHTLTLPCSMEVRVGQIEEDRIEEGRPEGQGTLPDGIPVLRSL